MPEATGNRDQISMRFNKQTFHLQLVHQETRRKTAFRPPIEYISSKR